MRKPTQAQVMWGVIAAQAVALLLVWQALRAARVDAEDASQGVYEARTQISDLEMAVRDLQRAEQERRYGVK